MDDYSALASRIASSVGVLKGCLILSRDGLVLGASSAEDESAVKPAWLRFAQMGEPHKGFVEFGDEVWAYVRRGPFAAFAVAPVGVRPGVMMEQLDQGLLTAEEARSRRETLRVPDVYAAPSGKPRTSLHKEPAAPHEPSPAPVSAPASEAAARTDATGSEGLGTDGFGGPAPPAASGPSTSGEPAPQPSEAEPAQEPGYEETDEVDRVLLAQEFSRLLQETEPGDEDETA